MADTKISGMTAASTLDGTEVLPLVQSSANVKATVDAIVARATTIQGPPGTPGQSYGSVLLSGGGYRIMSTTSVDVSAASYAINGVVYSSAQATLTLSAADGSNNRFDVIVVNTSGVAAVVEGTASATPSVPSIDPLTQLAIGLVLIVAASGASSTTTNIYLEDTEWTSTTSGGTVVKNSTSNPYAGTKDIEYTAAASGDYANLSNGSAFDTTTRNQVDFRIRSKAAWASAKSLLIQWYNGSTPVGQAVALKTGVYGFNSSTTGSYQLVVIPMGAFGVAGLTVTALRFTVTGGGSTIGFYLDNITMQGGVSAPVAADRMRWRGNYSSAVQYVLNDVIAYGGGVYIALQNLLGTTPGGTGWGTVVDTAGVSDAFSWMNY